MPKIKNILSLLLCMAVLITTFAACSVKSESQANNNNSNDKLKVVTTIFSSYDFVRQIAGENVDLDMLLKPGSESHSYDPTPQDIIKIEKSDVFIYVGGDSDDWVDNILDSVDKSKITIIKLMDCVKTVTEETAEGMTPNSEEEEGEEEEYDEHVWTSPVNAQKIVSVISEKLCQLDTKNAETIKSNTASYLNSLKELDSEFLNVINTAKRKEIIVGDRFPLRYFVEQYGLTYGAAFPGCSGDTQASASTIAYLTNKVKEDNIPIVFHIELSNAKVCDSICEATVAKPMVFYTLHNVSKEDFEKGETYVSLMKKNVVSLKEALN